jgi:Immunoglobulin-like domain of bacterial spore germination
MRRALAACIAVAVAAVALGTAAGAGGPRAVGLRGVDSPAVVRFTVTFSGGPLRIDRIFATDPAPFSDGVARARVRGATLTTAALTKSAGGSTVQITSKAGQLSVSFRGAPGRFKYFGYRLLKKPERLLLEFWKSSPPAVPMRKAIGGCLAFSQWAIAAGTASASGSERNLFEHMFLVQVRDARGQVVGRRGVAALNGRWTTNVTYRVSHRQAGTLEAVDLSEGDGSLICLAHMRVALRP